MTETDTGRGHAPPGSVCAADVLLLHGFFGTPWTMRLMGRRLDRQGLRAHCPWYESWANPFGAIVDRISALVAARGLGSQRPVHFVGHSMGGLVARAVVARTQPRLMGRMVMIGTPNAGSEMADFCTRMRMLRPLLGRAGPTLVTNRLLPLLDDLPPPAYPFGIIAGDRPLPSALRILPPPHDGRVSVASTHLAGETDHIVLPVAHAAMPFQRAVQDQAFAFLEYGRFERNGLSRD